MKIQIIGSGCPKCQALADNARQAAAEAGIQAEVEKVTESERIMAMGVMITPGLAINGVVKSTGKLLAKSEIARLLEEGSENG